ncbi:hypothetical protein sos41_13800 [Alphaproteobacteria bacterium SO-S41]|nr:hypothetical protein sos41_13800 [Alphaproteobacteria bacterium SO-S41]
MKFMTTVSLAALAVALAACGSGGAGGPMRVEAQRADSSGTCLLGPFIRRPDGSLTKADMDAGIRAGFLAADLNADGSLDSGEITRLNDAKSGTCDVTPFISWDTSGRITPDAYGARYVTAFDQADVNADGIVTAEELQHTFRKPKKPPREMPEAGSSTQ